MSISRTIEPPAAKRNAAHAILQLSSDPSVIVSAAGVIVAANAAFSRLFDAEREALAGRSMARVTGIDDRHLKEMLTCCSRTSGRLPFAGQFSRLKQGPTRWHIDGVLLERGPSPEATSVYLRLRPTMAAAQAFRRLNEEIVQLKREVQRRQKAELALRESEARLGGIISSAMDAIISVDERQRITDFNQAAERMFRVSSTEAVGQSIDRFIPERFRGAEAAPIEAFGKTRAGALGTISGRRADGEEFPIEASISQLHTQAGKFHTVILRDVTERRKADEALRQHTRSLEIINRIGATLAAELDLEKLVQAVTDAGREVTGAQFGAFFYNVTSERGEAYTLYCLSGVPREAFANFPMPRNTAIFDPTFRGHGTIRLGDVTQDPRYGKNPPYHGMPKGHLPVRSYLAVPVVSRSGSVLGGLFYGHAEPNVFTEEAEQILAGIAAQAAIAIDNARLYREAQKELAERKQAEERTLALTAKFMAIFNQSGIFAGILDLEGRLREVNDLAVHACGYTREDVLDKPFWDTPWWRGAATVQECLREATRQVASGSVFRAELPYWLADGTECLVEFAMHPIRDETGAVRFLYPTGIDVTERKRGEHAIASLAAIVTSSGDAIVGMDLQGTVTSWNRAAELLYGYQAEEILGRPVLWIIPRDRHHEEPLLLEKVAAGSAVEHYETVRVRKDGTAVHVSLSLSPVKDPQGRVIGASKIARDITERKRSEAALVAANQALEKQKAALADAVKELESFSYSVSHDLRAPLRTIDAFSRIIHEEHEAALDEEAKRCLGIVRKAAAQAGELIDDLLEFSRLGRQSMQLRTVNMTALADEVAEELKRTHLQRTIDIAIGSLPTCRGDARLLKLIWTNLLGNAVKYTQYRQAARIEVGAMSDETDGEAVVYYVKDNGVGFNMAYTHKLFGVFQRLHNKEEFDGTGVGLAIVHRIVQRHGGKVWADGAVNQGATFYVSLRKAAA